MVPNTQSSLGSGLTKKAVVILLATWFVVLFAARTKFTIAIVPPSLLVNLFVGGTLVVLLVALHRISPKRDLFFLFGFLAIYALSLVIWEGLPIKNFLQFFLSTKLIFIFLAARLVPFRRRQHYWLSFSRITFAVFYASVPFAVLDYLFPNALFELAKDGRGIGGVSTGSFFASRVLYSEFLLLVLILLTTIPRPAEKRYYPYFRQLRPITLLMILVLLFLTYSRKEILIGIFIVILDLWRAFRVRPAWASKTMMVIVLLIAIFAFFYAYRALFLENFTDNYVRFKILISAWDIFSDRFPFGSGPGTFGTGMSKSYTAVYQEFHVPSAVTGYGGRYDGPIFDLYYISFFAEYGVGAFALLALFLHPFNTPAFSELEDLVDVRRFRLYVAFLVFGAGFFVPIMGNLVGVIAIIYLGLLAQRRST